MGLDSMFIGVTGLEAYQNQIDVISNNIANVGTTGFKGQDVNFEDMLYQAQSYATAPTQTTGGINGQDVGLGVQIGSIDTDFSQGGLQTTGVNTNLALNGDGFFILQNPNGSGSPVYTRNGDFSLNSNGMLYDGSSGMAVLGYMAGKNGVVTQTGTPGDITIPIGLQSQAVGTGFNAAEKFGPTGDQVFDVSMGGNLDQSQWSTEATGVAAGTPGTGQPYTVSTTIYDSLGNAHLAQITYTPVATGATGTANGLPTSVANASGQAETPASRWSVTVSFTDGTQFTGINPATGAPNATASSTGVIGYAYFDQNGQFINTSSQLGSGVALAGADVHSNDANPSLADGNQLNITSWGTADAATAPTAGGPAPATGPIGLDFSGMTSLAGTDTANVTAQNGYAAGVLSNITIGADGTITGSFSNGQTSTIGRVAVATFQNEQGLERVGDSDFAQTANSGLAEVGTAGTGNYGAIVSGSLEQSNVSIADEFTKMIAAQNAYQANSKSITTADEDLQTIIGLIR
jgi:flagellar hook protein FlgE